MKKRIVALVCCLSLTVGLFSYQPPKAKALLTEASLATSVIWTFMQSAGLSFSGNNAGSQAWIDSCQSWYNKFMEAKADVSVDFLGWLGYDSWSAFLADIRYQKNPTNLGYQMFIPKAISAKLAEFTQWFIGELGLTSGGESKPVVSVQGGYTVTLKDGSTLKMGKQLDSRYYSPGDIIFTIPAERDTSLDDVWRYIYFSDDTYLGFALSTYNNLDLYYSFRCGHDFGSEHCTVAQTGPYKPYYDYISLAVKDDGHIVFIGHNCYKSISNKDYLKWLVLSKTYDFFTLEWLEATSIADSAINVTQPGTYSPAVDTDGDKATVVTVPDLDGDIASINDLLQQILDKLAANDLTVSGSVEGADAPDVPATDVGWKGTIEKIYQGILSLPQAIADAIKAVLEKLFAPDAALMQEMTDTFKGKFSFLPTLHKVGTDLFGMTAETDPPVIWIHLEDAEGKYTYGGPVKALDLSWYQRYKADVDKLISGFLWLAFLWLLFKRAASIIHGGEMYTEYASDIRDYYRSGKKDDGPTVPTNRRLDK